MAVLSLHNVRALKDKTIVYFPMEMSFRTSGAGLSSPEALLYLHTQAQRPVNDKYNAPS